VLCEILGVVLLQPPPDIVGCCSARLIFCHPCCRDCKRTPQSGSSSTWTTWQISTVTLALSSLSPYCCWRWNESLHSKRWPSISGPYRSGSARTPALRGLRVRTHVHTAALQHAMNQSPFCRNVKRGFKSARLPEHVSGDRDHYQVPPGEYRHRTAHLRAVLGHF